MPDALPYATPPQFIQALDRQLELGMHWPVHFQYMEPSRVLCLAHLNFTCEKQEGGD